MSSHQQAQNNSGATYHQTYQYVTTTNDQVLEIPSNINYQLENVIASGGVQYILSDGSILVQKETNKKDPNKNTFRRMIVVNQGDLQQATTIQVPTQQRIVSQPVSNGTVETKNIVTSSPAQNQHRSTTQAMTPIGPLTLTAEEYNELLQRRLEKQAEAEQHQVRVVEMPRQQEVQQQQQQRRVQQVQLQPQMQEHQNIAVQVQKIVQSLEDEKGEEMHLIEPKIEHDGSTISEGQLQEHSTKTTEGKNAAGRPFACDQCGKKFLLKHHLTTHARVHTGERPHVCIHCGKDFAHKHCLNTHLLLHSTERPYQCKECKKCFTLKHHLLTHSRVHSRDRPFVCQDCGKTFSLKRHLVTHMKFHAGERPYICQTCGESFAQEQHLVMHSRFHGSVDPFVCQDCGATFPRKFQLVNHGKLHGRVPHECTVCGQEFLQKRTLVAHMRQHTDAPHCCLNCGEGFRTKSELTAHQRIVHNIQPPVRSKNAAAAASATATSNNSNVHEQAQHIEQQEIDETHFLKQEHQQYETIQTIEDSHGGHTYQTITMVPSSSSPEHKTIRIQQHGGQQAQHVCQQCGTCYNSREALQMHLRLHTGDKNLVTDLQLLTSTIPGHIFQSQGNTYIEIDGGKYNINGATLVANSSDGSSVPVQIITTSNGQQVIEQVQSISPSMLHQHQSQNEVQLSQQPIVYTTVHSNQDQNQGGTIQIVQQGQVQQQQPQQTQVIVQQQHPKPKTHFCQHCKKGFAAKHGLQMHNKKHPNGECTVRSHVCPQCNRAFLQKNHLMLHQRQHMEQNRGGSQQQIITQQMEVDGIKVEGSETSTIVLEDQEMKESQNISEEASSGENQLVEMRAHNVIIENTSSTVDGKMKPQADGVEMVASTNVETDGGSVGQVD